MADCPSTYTFDTGDYAEPESCSLLIEHNADDEPWHLSEWEVDGERGRVEWRWDKDDLVSHWPPPQDPLPKAWRAFYADWLLHKAFDGLIPVESGITANFRHWESLPTVVVEEQTASTGDAEARDPA